MPHFHGHISRSSPSSPHSNCSSSDCPIPECMNYTYPHNQHSRYRASSPPITPPRSQRRTELELSETQDKLRQREEKNKELKERIAWQKERIHNYEESNHTILGQIQSQHAEIKKLKMQLAEVTDERDALRKNFEKEGIKKKELESFKKKSEQTITALKAEVDLYKGERDTYRNEKESYKREAEESRRRLDRVLRAPTCNSHGGYPGPVPGYRSGSSSPGRYTY